MSKLELQDIKNEKSFSKEPTLDEITDNVVGKLNNLQLRFKSM